MIEVLVINRGGGEETKRVVEGTKLYGLVSSADGTTILLNGCRVTRDVELRDGDEVEVSAKSGKNSR